jgi:Protein of unknown function (DUF5818)
MKTLIASLFALAALAPSKPVFLGTITDSVCANADHAPMRMAPTDAECTKACVDEHDAKYVLYDGKQTYELSAQRTPEKFAGQKVRVTGTKNDKKRTIQVESIAPAK